MRHVAAACLFLAAATPAVAGFLTDDSGGYLLDDRGGRLLIGGGVHTINTVSVWGPDFAPTQSLSVFVDVAADKSGIYFHLFANDSTSPVTFTGVSRVVSLTDIRPLASCPGQQECSYFWPTPQMAAGPNEYALLFRTLANPVGYAYYNRVSKPQ